MSAWRMVLAALACACTPVFAQIPDDLTEPGQHPVSVGFANPDDLTALLDYRLPDWWSREWTADLDLDGEALTRAGYPNESVANRFDLRLASRATWQMEGERVQASYGGQLASRVDTYRQGGADRDRLGRDYDLSGRFDGEWRRYVSDDWALVYGAGAASSYDERMREEIDERTTSIDRTYQARATAGVGYGRVRNVVPVIRAARLNERLVALGYAPLSAPEVVRVAEGLSRQRAYSSVFARPDRRFWSDVLTPVTQRDALGPFETYYLAEVLQENVGDRYEGFQVDGLMEATYSHLMQIGNDSESWRVAPTLRAMWARNLDLDHQIALEGAATYSRTESLDVYDDGRRIWDYGTARLSCEYLWAIADRSLWTTTLETRRDYAETDDGFGNYLQRQLSIALTSTYRLYVEDRLALQPSVALSYTEFDQDDARNINRRLTYGLHLVYAFDTTLN